MGGQIAILGPNVARGPKGAISVISVFSGPRNHSRNPSNLKFPPAYHSKY